MPSLQEGEEAEEALEQAKQDCGRKAERAGKGEGGEAHSPGRRLGSGSGSDGGCHAGCGHVGARGGGDPQDGEEAR